MFRGKFSPIFRSIWLHLQHLAIFNNVAAGWCHGWVGSHNYNHKYRTVILWVVPAGSGVCSCEYYGRICRPHLPIFFSVALQPAVTEAASLLRFPYLTKLHTHTQNTNTQDTHTTHTLTRKVRLFCIVDQLIAAYTTHNKHKRRTSMTSAWFEPAIPTIERLQTFSQRKC